MPFGANDAQVKPTPSAAQPPPQAAKPPWPGYDKTQAAVQDMAAHKGDMASIVPPPPDPGQSPGSAWDQFMGVMGRALETAPWVVGMRGNAPGVQGVPEPPAPDPGVLRQGQAAVETALRPQGPWGPQGEPSAPAPSPVPRTGGPTVNTLNAADDAAQQGAYDTSLEKAVGTAANRSVAGYNLNANKNNPAAIASRAGQSAVEQALSNLDQPPPAPYQGGQGGIPTGPGPKPATQVSAQELRAFLEQNGIPEDQIQQSLAAHSEFVGTNAVQKPSAPEDVRANALQKPGLEAPPEPPKPGPKSPAPLQAKATPPAPKPAAKAPKAKPTPSGPPAQRPAVSFEQREVDIPTRTSDPDGQARSWLRKAAGILRSTHDISQILTGNPAKIAKTTMSWVVRNYPEVTGRNPQTLNKIAEDILRRLSGGASYEQKYGPDRLIPNRNTPIKPP